MLAIALCMLCELILIFAMLSELNCAELRFKVIELTWCSTYVNAQDVFVKRQFYDQCTSNVMALHLAYLSVGGQSWTSATKVEEIRCTFQTDSMVQLCAWICIL